MNIHGWKFVKKKSGLFKKRPSEKKFGKKILLNKSKKKKNEERKEVEVQFELYYVKLVELMLFEE